jgi:hypothetical protein
LLAVPNPTTASTRIRVEFPGAGAPDIAIFDATGRLISSLDASPEGNAFVASWDGTDDRGRRLAPGIYFFRATTPGYEPLTGKLVLTR